MIAGLNILGFVYNSRKYFLGLTVAALLLGAGLKAKNYYHEWHSKPLSDLKKALKVSQEELNATKEELMACQNIKRVECFVTKNRSVFDIYRERIKEIENEELNVSSSGDDYDWMYQ